MEKEDYIIGWVFKGKFFKTEDDMRGMTINSDNKPIPVYNPSYVEGVAMAIKTLQQRQNDCVKSVMQILMPPLFNDEPLFKDRTEAAKEYLSKVTESDL